MGRRRPFIDKKTATTYSVLYSNADGTEEDNSITGGSQGTASGRPDHSAIIAQLQGRRDEAPVLQLPEEKRREIVDLGFPDDGYDYLKHLKEGIDDNKAPEDGSQDASSTSEVQAAFGPRMFLPAPYVEPPPEDVKVIDARRLPPQQQTVDEEDVFGTLREVAAFSRDVEEQNFRGGGEVEALEQSMSEIERKEDHGGAEGHGNLLDDFVSAALAMAPGSSVPSRKLATVPELEGEEMGSDVFDDLASSLSDDSRAELRDDGLLSQGGRRAGSIASTYWRPERTDRTEMSSVLDDRFEQLALDYDSDELGDLDELDGGGASLDDFDDILTECLASQQSSQYLKVGGGQDQGSVMASKAALHPRQQDAAPHMAVAKAKELVMSGVLRENDDAGLVEEVQPAACNWDCETVLSNYSNMDNHPGLLLEPNRRARAIRRSRQAQSDAGASHDQAGLLTMTRPSSEPESVSAPSQTNSSQQRSKTEDPEEKRQRKKLVKEVRREARMRKKSTKEHYKETASSVNLDPMHGQRRIAA